MCGRTTSTKRNLMSVLICVFGCASGYIVVVGGDIPTTAAQQLRAKYASRWVLFGVAEKRENLSISQHKLLCLTRALIAEHKVITIKDIAPH